MPLPRCCARVLRTAHGSPPYWRVLRTAISPAILAGQLAVRSTPAKLAGVISPTQ